MSVLRPFLITCVIAALTSACTPAAHEGYGIDTNEASDFAVENIEVDKGLSNAWTLKGMVRNNGSRDVGIAVKIKFLNASGDIVYTAKAVVNDFDLVPAGSAAPFEYATDPANFDGVERFDIEPYERP